MSAAANALTQARAFAESNLPALAAEILRWQDTGLLQGQLMRELAGICRQFDGAHPMTTAESLVNKAALRLVANPIPSQEVQP